MDLAGIPGIAQIYITIIVGKVTATVYPHLDLHNDYKIILAYASISYEKWYDGPSRYKFEKLKDVFRR